jgi:hypothetical protein
MAKPIPHNPNFRKVTAPQSEPAQKEVRVVVVPPASQPPVIPAKPKAEPDARKGRNRLKGMIRQWVAGTEGGNNR